MIPCWPFSNTLFTLLWSGSVAQRQLEGECTFVDVQRVADLEHRRLAADVHDPDPLPGRVGEGLQPVCSAKIGTICELRVVWT